MEIWKDGDKKRWRSKQIDRWRVFNIINNHRIKLQGGQSELRLTGLLYEQYKFLIKNKIYTDGDMERWRVFSIINNQRIKLQGGQSELRLTVYWFALRAGISS